LDVEAICSLDKHAAELATPEDSDFPRIRHFGCGLFALAHPTLALETKSRKDLSVNGTSMILVHQYVKVRY